MVKPQTRLEGLSVLVIDATDVGNRIVEAFESSGAKVIFLTDQDADILDQVTDPDIVVLDPETIGDRRLRALAFRLVTEDTCISIIYGDAFAENHYGTDDMIHKSRPITDVVDAAIRSLPDL